MEIPSPIAGRPSNRRSRRGGSAVAALQGRDVSKKQLPARLVRPDDQIEHVLGGRKTAFRVEGDVLVTDPHPAAVGGDVLRLQLVVDLLFANPEAGEALPRNLQVDDLLLVAKQIDLVDPPDEQHLAAEKLRIAAQFGFREPVAGDRQENAVNVAEIVHHDRSAADRRRQLRLHVGDLAAEFVPNLRDRILMIPVLNDGGDDGPAAAGFRIDPLELPELLARAFDRVRDLLRDLFGTGPRIGRDDRALP